MLRIIERLQNIDRRILYALMFLTMAVPLIKPFPVPMAINEEVRNLYNFIEKLGPNDVVLMSSDYSPAYAPTVAGAAHAIYTHLMRRNVKVIFTSFEPDGPMMSELIIEQVTPAGKKYGEDYVHLGYRAGGEGALASALQDFHKAYPRDFRGNAVESLPLMQKVKTAKDLALALPFMTGGYAGGGWIRQLVQPYGRPLAVTVTGMMGPAHIPYYQAKQLVGLVVDMNGGAMYETLVKRPGVSLAGMGAQTLTQSLVILYMIIANVAYFTLKKKQGKR